MLVCAFFTHFGTRDRGCSAHPAFPAPSIFEGGKEFASLGRKRAARTRTHTLSSRRPCESRDPYAAAEFVRARWSTALLQQQPAVVMGPCFRRDDDGGYNASPLPGRRKNQNSPCSRPEKTWTGPRSAL